MCGLYYFEYYFLLFQLCAICLYSDTTSEVSRADDQQLYKDRKSYGEQSMCLHSTPLLYHCGTGGSILGKYD